MAISLGIGTLASAVVVLALIPALLVFIDTSPETELEPALRSGGALDAENPT